MIPSGALESKKCGTTEKHQAHRWWWQEAAADTTETFGPTHYFVCPGEDGARRIDLGTLSMMMDPRVTLVLHDDGRVTWENR
ncbi:hypothetical protein SEA_PAULODIABOLI_60 [Microbacterium phage PauloDiaboli]|nr:hypothetical protein SEA_PAULODIABOLI_60 [Microbacterium phage PauloDiaboli]QWY83911.1 hypothetical protein SEA_A3WALLY_61 [Microbacterium phage A3Wally]